MALRLRIDTRQLFPFVLFRSLAQLAFWLAIVAGGAAIASLFIHRQGELQSAIIGGVIGSLFAWIPLLPYELRIKPADMREGLVRVSAYLVRSNMSHVEGGARTQIGVGEWTARSKRHAWWKGNEVEVSVDGQAVVVRGPRSMIKPLWRNFRGPWREMLTPA